LGDGKVVKRKRAGGCVQKIKGMATEGVFLNTLLERRF
jgi:hypothetical protein